jgi:catechol 2,3-dioxygenase-like lactoylglutathione lyase family enzyme
MKIGYVSVFVDDQQRALRFSTDTLGFVKKTEIPMVEFRGSRRCRPTNRTASNWC